MQKKITIHIFGNPLLDFDNLPLKLFSELKKNLPAFEFKITDPNENLKPINKQMNIIDTVVGIDKVTVIDDIEKIQTEKIYSAHDFDLAFNLKLLKKIGLLNRALIFGVPPDMKIDEALKQLLKLIKQNLQA